MAPTPKAAGEDAAPAPHRKAAKVTVPTDDNSPKEDDTPHAAEENPLSKSAEEVAEEKAKLEEAVEDSVLRQNLERMVEIVCEVAVLDVTPAGAAVSMKSTDEAKSEALSKMSRLVQESTSSMSSIPKPLKFLKPHFEKLKQAFSTAGKVGDAPKRQLADVLSVLAMTMTVDAARDCLKYKLAGDVSDVGSWGHEYLRFLTAELTEEWDSRDDGDDHSDLLGLVDQIVPYAMNNGTEHEACDLLLEIEDIDRLLPHIDQDNFEKVCEYYLQCANYVPEPDDTRLFNLVYTIFHKRGELSQAMRVAMIMNDSDKIIECYEACQDDTPGNEDGLLKKQLALILGRQRVNHTDNESSECNDLISNVGLSEYFMALAQDLDIVEAKEPEEIYKSNLDAKNATAAASVDSARGNLASTFVNAFVNCGFGQDKLVSPEGSSWMYKNKDHGMMSAAASLGCIVQWDVDGGLAQIDKYLYAEEDYIKAGALLAVGIVNAGVRNECDPALALLSEYVEPGSSYSTAVRCGAAFGMGLAYARSEREEITELLKPLVEDADAPFEVVCVAALSAALVNVGTGSKTDLGEIFCALFLERSQAELDTSHARLLALALGMLYLRRQEDCQVTLMTLAAAAHPIANKYAAVTVESCAYAGTGDVLKIQKWLDMAGDHLNDDEEEEEKADDKTKKKDENEDDNKKNYDKHQSVAVIGIALVAMGEDIGSEMLLRTAEHLLQYGDPVVRRAVPLMLGLLSASNPQSPVIDTLSKLSHDTDAEVSMAAIFALGVVSAGTNNSRVANVLRGLAQYYYREANHLFIVRISQGLLHMGKGTMTIAPFHSDRTVLSPLALSGLLLVMHACLDAKNTILGHQHYLLFALMLSAQPRLLMTLDAELKPLAVSVRVGQAVDVVGQAGKPKTITGFQTHTTPVLFSHGDRAELATDEYLPVTRLLEGFVILRKNPDWVDTEKQEKKD